MLNGIKMGIKKKVFDISSIGLTDLIATAADFPID
jgi:hypothetical protein